MIVKWLVVKNVFLKKCGFCEVNVEHKPKSKGHSRRNQFSLQASCGICSFVFLAYLRFCLLKELQLIVSVISNLSLL